MCAYGEEILSRAFTKRKHHSCFTSWSVKTVHLPPEIAGSNLAFSEQVKVSGLRP